MAPPARPWHDAAVDARDLEGIPLFADLRHKDREKIARWADSVDLPAGYSLLREGRFPHEFFIVLEGQVEVTKDGAPLATLGPGDFFGEIALLEDERRTATVVASTPVRVAVMGAREFDSIVEQMPTVAARLDAVMRERRSR
ncbi:MAG: cyclic nucleotide-binding domain-containing protein [Actinobacteria bacterium]|nr:MAG: cyclic nucleotide-binding domain-containing protein [Actinomycetota bacterium]